MKIAILGYSGCGKSTLARLLGEKHQMPVLHLDSVHFEAGWVEKQRSVELAEVQAFLDSHDGWVIDGNYSALEQQRRVEEADRIILLELNRLVCLWRILKRWLTYRGSTRPDMAADCNEKIDGEFLRWVLFEGRTARKKAMYNSIAKTYPDKCLRIRSVKQQREFLKQVK